jgi:hypothetical protein
MNQNDQKLFIILTLAASMIVGMSSYGMTTSVFAQGGEIPIVGGLCPEGHECICTPASGVFHDLTENVNINMGCDGSEGG